MFLYFQKLFATDFLPHGVCVRWQPGVLWVHVIADSLIALAYLCIPILLIKVVRRRKDIPFHWMFLAFGTFILACGATHVLDVVTLWIPVYRLDGLVRAITALASLVTAVCLVRLGPAMIRVPTAAQWEATNQTLAAEVLENEKLARDLKASHDALNLQVEEQTRELSKLKLMLEEKIRDEQRTSQLLRDRERQFSLACEFGKVETWVWDLEGDTFVFSFAESGPDLQSSDYYATVHSDDRPQVRETFQKARDGTGDINVEFRSLRSDGTIRWCAARGAKEFSDAGLPPRIYGLTIDISQRKAAETALQESETQLEVFVDAIPTMVWMANADGFLTWYNRRWYEYTGKTKEEIEGWGWQSVHDPNELPLVMQRWQESINTGKPFEMEFPLRRYDGVFQWFLTRICPVLDQNGKVSRWFGTNTDVTEIRETREALRQSERSAEEANRAKSEFLAAMSHEIRTPMNAILGMADLLWESELEASQRRYVDVFRRAGANLLALVNDILDLSKIEAGQFELENIDFELADVAERTVEMIRARTQGKRIELVSHIAPQTPSALIGDPIRLQQVLINLLGNAVKFTEHGGIVLKIWPDLVNTYRIHFEVTDTGIGIQREKLESIFNDFTQAESSTTRRFGGTGLGLSICRRLVRRMGGQLNVRSEFGKGSTFYFDAVFEKSTLDKPQRTDPVAGIAGLSVLIVDNNATNRLIFSEMCSAWAMKPCECATADGALAKLQSAIAAGKPFDLIILDRLMPDGGGFEFVPRIRQVDLSVPIIMTTSDKVSGDETKSQQLGLAGYAVKPVRRADLLRMICNACGATGPRAESRQHKNAAEGFDADGSRPRILIAEDSDDNRFLLQEYLKSTPCELTFVENGELALEAAGANAFDLILMDIQMPIMDGLTAAKLIGQRARERGISPPPIVALTANARKEDYQASQDAGCVAHLSKPISKPLLLKTIQAKLRESIPATQYPVQLSIHIPDGLEAGAKRYIQSRKNEVPRLMTLLETGEFDQLRGLAHDLKGTGTSFGFPDLTRLGALIEISARAQDAAAVSVQLLELSKYVTEAAGVVSG